MNLPEQLRRELDRRSLKLGRQRVIFALLLQAPPALRGPRHHHYHRPPLAFGSSKPFGGIRAAARQD